MRIKTAEIHNWRSIADEKIEFDRLMVFIGQNNHGKSNILTALLFFFGEITCEELDFHNDSDELYVELTFDDLDEADKTTFKKYLSGDGSIRVRRLAKRDGLACEYHGYIERPEDDWLKEERATEYTKREVATATPLRDYLPESGRITKDAVLAAQGQYIRDKHATLHFVYELEGSNFLGTKNVAKGIWGEVFFVPAVKHATDEFASTKASTVFGQLYSRVLTAMSANSQEFQNAKQQLHSLVRRLNKRTEDGGENQSRPRELADFEAMLESELGDDWNAEIDVEICTPDVDNILKVGTSVWVDDGVRTNIARKGQGLQRALIYALVRALAKLSKGTEQDKDVARRASRSTYFLFEEPELFLHPQAQRSLFASLRELAKQSQVLLCTHSAAFVHLDLFKSICRVYKSCADAPTKVTQCTRELFTNVDEKKRFNMVYWINPDRSELFFATKVILLEGQTDKTILPLLAKRMDMYQHGYSIVDCGSKDSIPQYISLLNYYEIPYVAVYDRDHQRDKTSEKIQCADAASKRIEDAISNALGYSVIFDNDIEEELGMEAGVRNKAYMALEHVNQEGFNIQTRLKEKITAIFGGNGEARS